MKKELTGYASIDKPQSINESYFKKNPLIPNTDIYTLLNFLTTGHMSDNAVDCKKLRVTYSKFMEDAKTISNALKELGVKKGDIIAINMPNLYQALVTFFACNRIGAIATYLNYLDTEKELCDYLNEFESPILINYNKDKEYNERIKKNTKVEYIITLSDKNVNSLNIDEDYRKHESDTNISFNDLGSIAEHKKGNIELPNSGREDALILFTSGTTGKPKSVVLTNKNVIASLIYSKNTCNFDNVDADKLLICVPFSYPYGLVASAFSSLFATREAILAPDISRNTVSYYYKKNPGLVMGSPALLELTMRNIPEGQDLSSVKYFCSGGDFLTKSVAQKGQEFFERHGASEVKIGNGFGNAETVSSGSVAVGVPIKIETAGKLLIGMTPMIIDPETKEELKYGETGLLCVSGDHVFKEYYKNPELTSEVKFIKDGKEFYDTGTFGSIDEEGYFSITGRKSRYYITSSLNKVYCDNVQSQINSLECVSECAVVPVPDEELLFVNKAFIVLNEGYEDTKETKEFILEELKKTSLKEHEYPRYIEIVDYLPKKEDSSKIDYSFLEGEVTRDKTMKKIIKK